jgi:D-alanyl-D-alanine carboxypeptidase
MSNFIEKVKSEKSLIISDTVFVVVLVLIVGALVWQFGQVRAIKQDLDLANESLGARLTTIEADIATTTNRILDALREQQDKSASFEDAIDDISDSVGTLEKLSKTDKELLQKYSRVYFLSENYVPLRLSEIPEKYILDPKRIYKYHSLALPYLKRLIDRAASKDVELKVSSAYRSFADQTSLKASYLWTYGTGSNQFSADQGYSEHQLGTAVDLVVPSNPTLTEAFENTAAFDWLKNNAHKYGYILSYPKGNSYYAYEPWHWRFVGVDLASDLYDEGKTFADLDQREIDKYLVKIFD